jgi:hypothetical protein
MVAELPAQQEILVVVDKKLELELPCQWLRWSCWRGWHCLSWCNDGGVARRLHVNNNGRRYKFDIALNRELIFAWPINAVSMCTVSIISYLSSLHSSSIQLESFWVVNPNSLPPLRHICQIQLFVVKSLIRCNVT